jgi:hypothetical protein
MRFFLPPKKHELIWGYSISTDIFTGIGSGKKKDPENPELIQRPTTQGFGRGYMWRRICRVNMNEQV